MSWSVRVKHDDKDCYRISLRIGNSRWKVGNTHCYDEDEHDAWVSVMKEAVKLEMMMTELIGEK